MATTISAAEMSRMLDTIEARLSRLRDRAMLAKLRAAGAVQVEQAVRRFLAQLPA